jgi:hypothetical protein
MSFLPFQHGYTPKQRAEIGLICFGVLVWGIASAYYTRKITFGIGPPGTSVSVFHRDKSPRPYWAAMLLSVAVTMWFAWMILREVP